MMKRYPRKFYANRGIRYRIAQEIKRLTRDENYPLKRAHTQACKTVKSALDLFLIKEANPFCHSHAFTEIEIFQQAFTYLHNIFERGLHCEPLAMQRAFTVMRSLQTAYPDQLLFVVNAIGALHCDYYAENAKCFFADETRVSFCEYARSEYVIGTLTALCESDNDDFEDVLARCFEF